ncbi:NADP-dependent aldehyde dehydrogenase [Agreia bicolorata]|uniref:NADP-dependent aldehyde dehydrogenase n=1 Tax=Agreia bicolorata TaxID=110935 RepID=A0A1T4XIN5_9MICO|nr:aldehyde dehydrogenase (NADP(+)) [Agreia bicolorata]SKA89429.1 NADP-dependent aldehyde dehydrogenase [Agreia bicolorata]
MSAADQTTGAEGAVPETTPVEFDRMLDAAVAARRPASASTSGDRAGWLREIAARLDAARDELVSLALGETHLPQARLEGEVGRTTGQLRMFADALDEGSYLDIVIDHADPQATPPKPELRRILIPIGVVGVYAASNFPFAFSVAGGDTASALAVGCPVVVKAHPGHGRTSARTAELVIEALASAGAPDGIFALVHGFDAGVSLIEDERLQAAAFTGSVPGGRALADLAAARSRPISFYGELGSINPVVVTRGADASRGEELAAGLAGSFTLGLGQFCTKPGIVFVPASSALEAALVPLVPTTGGTMLTDAIAEGYLRGAGRLAALQGVRQVVAPSDAGSASLYSVSAADFQSNAEEISEEVFGPTTVLVRYSSEAELSDALDVLPGTLTATVHAEPGEHVEDIVAVLGEKAGRVLFGGWPTGVAVTWAQHHGGPWPATNTQHTSVGVTAVRRFQRPLVFQDAPEALLPEALRDGATGPRRVDGVLVL